NRIAEQPVGGAQPLGPERTVETDQSLRGRRQHSFRPVIPDQRIDFAYGFRFKMRDPAPIKNAIQSAIQKAIWRNNINAVSEAAPPQPAVFAEGQGRDHIAGQCARRLFAESRNPRRSRKPFVLPTDTPNTVVARQPDRFPHWLVVFSEGGQLAGRKTFGTLP